MGGLARPVYLFGGERAAQAAVPQPSLMDTLFKTFTTGLQIAQAIKSSNEESQQRKLAMEVTKHQLNTMRLEEKLQPIQHQLEIAKLLQGMPGQAFQSQLNPQQIPVPGMADVPQDLGGPGGYGPSTASTTFGVNPSVQTVEAPNRPLSVDLSGVFPGYGQMQVPILNRQQLLQQTLDEKFRQAAMDARAKAMEAGAVTTATEAAKEPFKNVDLPEGLIPGVGGGKIDEKAIPIITAAMSEAGSNKRNAATIAAENARSAAGNKTSVQVANIGAANTMFGLKQGVENELRTQFAKESQPYTQILDQVNNVHATAADKTAASDDLLVNAFNKLIDSSVVRDPEYARATGVGGLREKAQAWLSQLQGGGSLTPFQRNQLVNTADKVGQVARNRYNVLSTQYTGTATRKGVDPRNVILTSPAASQSGPTYVNPSNGQRIQWNGTAWVPAQ